MKNNYYGYFFLFIGYVLGRIGHVFYGSVDTFHHWIFGVILIGYSTQDSIYFEKYKQYILYFGIGLVISDFIDMTNFRIYGKDIVTEYNLIGID